MLSFDYLREVESSQAVVDSTDVFVLTSSGGAKLLTLDARDPSTAVWTSSGDISLAEFAGQTIRVGFRFTTVNASANNFIGWLIDNVRVE